jgi:hypothetical protein
MALAEHSPHGISKEVLEGLQPFGSGLPNLLTVDSSNQTGFDATIRSILRVYFQNKNLQPRERGWRKETARRGQAEQANPQPMLTVSANG